MNDNPYQSPLAEPPPLEPSRFDKLIVTHLYGWTLNFVFCLVGYLVFGALTQSRFLGVTCALIQFVLTEAFAYVIRHLHWK